MPKVSVIIPVYGVEKYIERCARSLFEQTLDDMEFLFIDDCTPDQSIDVLKKVLEDYPERKSQVVIHNMEKNSGQAAVRKWGMLNAKGDFLIHCDSDDWVEKEMYEVLYKLAIENNADMASCNFCEERGQETKFVFKIISSNDSTKTLLKRLLSDVGHLNSMCVMLIARNLCTNIHFPASNQSEDFAMMSQILMKSKKRAVTERHFYHYLIHQQSISHNPDKEKCLNRLKDAVNNRQLVYNCIKDSKYGEELAKEIIVSKAMTKYFVIKLEKDKEFKPLWNSIFPEVNKSLLFAMGVPLKFKFFHLLVQLNMPCIYHLLKLFPQFR